MSVAKRRRQATNKTTVCALAPRRLDNKNPEDQFALRCRAHSFKSDLDFRARNLEQPAHVIVQRPGDMSSWHGVGETQTNKSVLIGFVSEAASSAKKALSALLRAWKQFFSFLCVWTVSINTLLVDGHHVSSIVVGNPVVLGV